MTAALVGSDGRVQGGASGLGEAVYASMLRCFDASVWDVLHESTGPQVHDWLAIRAGTCTEQGYSQAERSRKAVFAAVPRGEVSKE